MMVLVFFFKQKTAYEMRISDWSSDVCSSDLGSRCRMAWLMRILPDSVRIGANKAMMRRGRPRRFANWQWRGRRNTQMIPVGGLLASIRSEEHTSELQSLMRTSYAVFCLKKKNSNNADTQNHKPY